MLGHYFKGIFPAEGDLAGYQVEEGRAERIYIASDVDFRETLCLLRRNVERVSGRAVLADFFVLERKPVVAELCGSVVRYDNRLRLDVAVDDAL